MIPNILTTVRLFLIPLFAYFVLGQQNLAAAGIVFLCSGITDVVDGYIARRFQMITEIGKVYDPLVDKLMQITALICLSIAEIIPSWAIWIIIAKEGIMIIAGSIMYCKHIVMQSNWYGKTATVIFYAVIFIMIFGTGRLPQAAQTVLMIIIILAALASAFGYLVQLIRRRK